MQSRIVSKLGFAGRVRLKPSFSKFGTPAAAGGADWRPRFMSTVNPVGSNVHIPGPKSVPEPSKGIPVFVKAYYVARGIELAGLHGKLYPSSKQDLQPKSVTIHVNNNLNQYISIFNYGSVVFFNIPEEEHSNQIRLIKTAAILPIPEVLQHNESYKLLIHENLETPSVIHAEHLNIRSLDSSNTTIVSVVMAQTVAMDYYAATVDKTIATFTNMNMKIQDTGNFTALKETDLYKLIASNNMVFTNVLSKLGFFEGTDVAWEHAEYSNTWEALRHEFELVSRYNDLSLKLNIVTEDARFFLAVLQHEKSTQLEWIIILLIAAEMFIGIAGLGLQLMGMSSSEEKQDLRLQAEGHSHS